MSLAEPEKNPVPIIVSGLGRCGSSMMVKMLEAGGLPIVGGYYEEAESVPTSRIVAKLLDVRLWEAKAGDVIWMKRNCGEQAKSHRKLMRGMGMGVAMDDADFSKWLAWRSQNIPAQAHGLRILSIGFEFILFSPYGAAAMISDWLGERLDVAAMAAVVHPRTPECRPELEIPAEVLARVADKAARWAAQ